MSSMRQRLAKGGRDAVLEDVDDSVVVEDVDSDDEEEEEEEDEKPVKKSKGGTWESKGGPPPMDTCCAPKKQSKASGYNWSALSILILFVAIPVLTGLSYVYDYMNPDAAKTRAVYSNVFRCYNAVGDQDKLNKIDHILKKYKGKERALFTQLRGKYGMEYPECDLTNRGI